MAAIQEYRQAPYNPSQLEFNQAMSDFQKMFPGVEAQVIETVLRANKGDVDATIDQLLTLTCDDQTASQSMIREQSIPSRIPSSQVSDHRQLFPHTSSHYEGHFENVDLAKGEEVPLLAIHNWKPILFNQLPPDFLRIEGLNSERKGVSLLNAQFLQERLEENKRQRGALNDASDPELSQFLEDERIALFLQNEEFMAELRGDQDFMRTLHQETSTSTQSEDIFAESTKFGDDDALFKERLKHMGKISKKKFTQLAKMFSRKSRGAKDILDHGATPSRDRLLLNSDPLLVEDSDEDEGYSTKPSRLSGNEHRHY